MCILGSGQLLFPQLCQGHRRLSPGAAWVLNSAFQGVERKKRERHNSAAGNGEEVVVVGKQVVGLQTGIW